MNTSVTLDKKHFQAASEKAKKLGTTPKAYIESLIEHANRSFDDILAPIRKGFEGMSDEDLDTLFQKANSAARKRIRAKK